VRPCYQATAGDTNHQLAHRKEIDIRMSRIYAAFTFLLILFRN